MTLWFYSYTICIPFLQKHSVFIICFTCTWSDTIIEGALISSCSTTCTVLQYPVCVCVCVLVLQRVWLQQTHTDMQQLANKDEFCCAWQRFSVHYFPLYPACIPDLSSCLSCKDTLSGPDSSSHAHTACMAHTHSGCVQAPSHWQFYICREHM